MTQQNETGVITLLAGEVLAAFRRVKMNGATSRSIVYADAGEDFVGITQAAAAAIGDAVPVRTRFAPGTFKATANEASAIGASLYGAADGRVADTVSGEAYFIALEAASGIGAIIEAIPVSAPGFKTGGTTQAAAALAIPVTHAYVAKTTGAGGEVLTLANGTQGQLLTVSLVVDGGGAGVITPGATKKSGWTTITLDDAGDTVTLMYVDDTVGWIIIGAAGVAAPPVIAIT